MLLLPQYDFLYPTVYAFILYGGRFFATAGIAYFFADPSRPKPLGRPHIVRPSGFKIDPHLRREIYHSLLTASVFAVVTGSLYGYGIVHASMAYFNYDQYPAWWFWISIPAMLLLHDTLFYWLHRAMHSKLLFTRIHLLHHRSVYPTAFAAYSFSLTEAILEALIVTAIIFIIPVHPLAFLIFQTISTAYNVYGHCGREFYSHSAVNHWLFKWCNKAALHAHHHRHARGNYSFYFTFWDRALGTLDVSETPPTSGKG